MALVLVLERVLVPAQVLVPVLVPERVPVPVLGLGPVLDSQ